MFDPITIGLGLFVLYILRAFWNMKDVHPTEDTNVHRFDVYGPGDDGG